MSSAAVRWRERGEWFARLLGDRRSATAPPGAGTLALTVFLASLTVLFAGSLVALLVVRARAAEWPPAGAPGIPRLLWASTAALLACSASVELALRAIRRGDQQRLVRRLALTGALALVFLGLQTAAWWSFFEAETFHRHLYGFTFYMLTGLHAAHLVGGMVALALVTARARLGHYSWAFHPGVRHLAVYWHFLDGVWLVLFAVLLATG